MVANLEIVNGKASMFYAQDGGVPWHKEGTSVETAVSSKEAAHLAGIDWEVETRPIALTTGEEIPTHRAIVRKTDDKVLGVASKAYQPIQNADAFGFLDSLVQDNVLLYDTAGALNEGRTVWMLARMPKDLRIQNDIFAQYLLGVTSHDMTRSFQTFATQVRVVCENTLNAATGARANVSVRHSGDISWKLEEARKLLNATTAEHKRLHEWMKKLDKVKVTEDQMLSVRESMFGPLDDQTPTQRRAAIEAFMTVYNEEKDRCGQTAYTLANTVTGYSDHLVRVRDNSSRFASILGGRGAEMSKIGLAAVAKVAAVAR